MCYFNRLTRVACWLADYPERLQFCRDFVKPPPPPPRNNEIALQHFLAAVQEFFSLSVVLHAIFFFQQALAGIFFLNHPSPPSRVKWSAPNSFHPMIKFTCKMSPERAAFLDTEVFKGPRLSTLKILDLQTHFKPTETFQ